ncbi:hypothetical protein [Streptomyces sp. NBC_00564]|uniref:hypothetical protein n=1 Tax=Streptomyces sp. NBC_00564 TaxID=2903663 RepID=UPI00352D363B|nr:hypothetical protein OG256_00070 [Streptomyces sp. NBC_00564]
MRCEVAADAGAVESLHGGRRSAGHVADGVQAVSGEQDRCGRAHPRQCVDLTEIEEVDDRLGGVGTAMRPPGSVAAAAMAASMRLPPLPIVV